MGRALASNTLVTFHEHMRNAHNHTRLLVLAKHCQRIGLLNLTWTQNCLNNWKCNGKFSRVSNRGGNFKQLRKEDRLLGQHALISGTSEYSKNSNGSINKWQKGHWLWPASLQQDLIWFLSICNRPKHWWIISIPFMALAYDVKLLKLSNWSTTWSIQKIISINLKDSVLLTCLAYESTDALSLKLAKRYPLCFDNILAPATSRNNQLQEKWIDYHGLWQAMVQ